MAARGITRADALEALIEGERIEHYPEDTPSPSALCFARVDDRPLRVVVAYIVFIWTQLAVSWMIRNARCC